PDEAAGAAGVACGGFGIGPARAGDVEVDPRSRADELLEKLRGRDGAAPFAAHILDVGHVALELLLEIFVHGQPPDAFARASAGRGDVCAESFVVGEETGDLGT